jgi:hypothetical protein
MPQVKLMQQGQPAIAPVGQIISEDLVQLNNRTGQGQYQEYEWQRSGPF